MNLTGQATIARTTLATLPLSFQDPTEIVIVDGGSDWPAEVSQAIRSGAAGILVVQPKPAEFAELLTADQSTVVVVDSTWASNPVISAAAQAFRAAATSDTRLECRVILAPGSDFSAALLDQLTLVRALLSPLSEVRLRYRSDHGFHAEGTTDSSMTVDLSVVCTTAVPASATVRLLTSDGSVELQLPSGATAQPARLITVGPDGAVLAPTQYETGHRASLRRLRELLANAPADGLADLGNLHADVLITRGAQRT
jgi:hypothetical protein